MKILLKRGIISAIVFTNLFLVAATPIPVPLADSESSVVPAIESFKHTVPTTPSIVTGPLVVDTEDGPDLFPRDPTDKDTNKATTQRPKIMVPAEFLPQGSNPVMMPVPGAKEHNGWSSVLYILKLIDAAVSHRSDLEGPRETFKTKLEEKKYAQDLKNIASRIKEEREETEDLHPEDPKSLTLEQLQNRIQEEVTNLGMFSGELTMPLALIPRGLKIGMKVPYPGNEEAVESVEAILHFLHSGISDGDDRAKHLNHWSNYKLRLTQHPYKLEFPKGKRLKNYQSQNEEECLAFLKNVVQLDWEPQYSNLRVPPSTDKLGVDSLKNILQMMAHVGGSNAIKTSWEHFRTELKDSFDYKDIAEPNTWGSTEMTDKERKARQSSLLEEVKKHNEAYMERKGGNEGKVPKRIPRGRRQDGEKSSQVPVEGTEMIESQDHEGGGEDSPG
ncbi:hypothetical protein H0H93_009220, partial [Arthromyces matolae]